MHTTQELSEACRPSIESLNQMLEASRVKAQDLVACIKSVENTSTRMLNQYDKARKDIGDCYNAHLHVLNERRAELDSELQAIYNTKQVALSRLAAKAQESVDSIGITVEFVDKLRRYSSPAELLMHRRTIEMRLAEQMTKNLDVGLQNVSELEFIPNPNQHAMKTSFGYIRTADMQAPTKMAPIARPNTSVSTMNSLNSCISSFSNVSLSSNLGNMSNNTMNTPSQQQQLSLIASQLGNLQQQQHQASLHGSALGGSLASTLAALGTSNMGGRGLGSSGMENAITSAQLSQFIQNRMSNNVSSYVNNSANLKIQDMNLNPASYEKWSSGDAYSHDALGSMVLPSTDNLVSGDMKVVGGLSNIPPRSQIKRQKMIYHCKFGEFGVLEGQFTEPSGVAVNAQNDIIVADTNNHRIQIFDKEGRFKFQFGECGKRDGQLLYPNRVAVVKTSGDIIVTERSPTHQIQIYNQYGQFVRKFGANTLCYPRGVTVDNKGRIIVVECKVMRVIIFDQYGNVGHQFNCPNHLEFPNGVVVNDKQEIFISDNRAHCVKVTDFDISKIWDRPLLRTWFFTNSGHNYLFFFVCVCVCVKKYPQVSGKREPKY